MKFNTASVDRDKCIKCSRCVGICPERHLDLRNNMIVEINEELYGCIQCGHCMSVCPTQAIMIEGFDYSQFEDLPEEVPSLNDFITLLKARRSCRRYQDKPVPRELLEKIIETAATAPMGFPPHQLEILAFDSREKIDELIPEAIEEFKKWVYGFGNPVIRTMIGLGMKKEMVHQMVSDVVPAAKGMIKAWEGRENYVTYDAPSMLLFHSDKKVTDYQANGYIAMTYAMIAAEGLGLSSCIIGMIPPVFNYRKGIKEKYGIPSENEVVGSLIIGYRKSTHNRSIPREFKSVKWV